MFELEALAQDGLIDERFNSDVTVPPANAICAAYIYMIEVTLRELVVEELSKLDGPRWYKSALPQGDIMEKYEESKRYQRSTPWFQTVPLHPVYYLDFPELIILIERDGNWNRCFKKVFSPRKEVFVSNFRCIEPIRNAVAHNRKIESNAINVVKGAAAFLASSLGEKRVESLIRRCTDASGIRECLLSLRNELETLKECVHNARPVSSYPQWDRTKEAWWFDSQYLGADLSPLNQFFGLVAQYVELPKGRGTGYVAETWGKETRFSAIAADSLSVIDKLLKERRG